MLGACSMPWPPLQPQPCIHSFHQEPCQLPLMRLMSTWAAAWYDLMQGCQGTIPGTDLSLSACLPVTAVSLYVVSRQKRVSGCCSREADLAYQVALAAQPAGAAGTSTSGLGRPGQAVAPPPPAQTLSGDGVGGGMVHCFRWLAGPDGVEAVAMAWRATTAGRTLATQFAGLGKGQ
ncbi:hypothetical protein HaLaN_22360 [Haematococcus lacustris]|uniref:Uncharacterized protein n=1 Tax=Haematococcus lacustris TaxID=44745 RepID=A0A6A0A028_HAELA|nr:hypothetical protein HaLaN_22360 [Haematococcus lacustris]